ncbi:MAG: hypothetical protein JRH20_01420, partial [Deltaproteobacteria bacterium]|nr:hypothetical protein [Deltaproteobacteria bacterium]
MRRFAYGLVAIAAAFTFSACGDDDVTSDGPIVRADGGATGNEQGIVLREAGTGNEAGTTTDGPVAAVCDPTKIGLPCNPNAAEGTDTGCGEEASCLGTGETEGICTCDCTPDDPATQLVNEDSCPDQAYNVCGSVPLTNGTSLGLCLKKCDPKIGENTCTSPISCWPAAGSAVGIFDSAVCLFSGCKEDADCPIVGSEVCKTDDSVKCTDETATCLPMEEGGLEGLCVLPGNCDTISGNCAPREDNFNAEAKIGDPCLDDTECGAAMGCEREIDMAELALAEGACTEPTDCCSGQCTAGQCVPGVCNIHSRNGYCYQTNCSFDSLTEYACPEGSTCNRMFGVGFCQKTCTLTDASSCRGVEGDLAGDYECRAYNNLNAASFIFSDGPVCDWGDSMDCSVFGVQGLSCEFFGSGASNDTHMR